MDALLYVPEAIVVLATIIASVYFGYLSTRRRPPEPPQPDPSPPLAYFAATQRRARHPEITALLTTRAQKYYAQTGVVLFEGQREWQLYLDPWMVWVREGKYKRRLCIAPRYVSARTVSDDYAIQLLYWLKLDEHYVYHTANIQEERLIG